ncbi:MAG: hypothetical protein CVV49_09195 [Spirochaetae bacterium HGW-Spirochaetae-5]|nr:MAG: hypothetical protein CVV49_09195 [Spirochaetae bacterium HGW-Spirochaetae-5]
MKLQVILKNLYSRLSNGILSQSFDRIDFESIMIYSSQTLRTHPRPLSFKRKRGELEKGIYCFFQGNNLFYEAPLFFIKERGAAVAGGECESFYSKSYGQSTSVYV